MIIFYLLIITITFIMIIHLNLMTIIIKLDDENDFQLLSKLKLIVQLFNLNYYVLLTLKKLMDFSR